MNWRKVLMAFRSGAASDDHAQRITAHIVAQNRRWRPTPADVCEVADDRMPQSVEKRGPLRNCAFCYGSGWQSTERDGYCICNCIGVRDVV